MYRISAALTQTPPFQKLFNLHPYSSHASELSPNSALARGGLGSGALKNATLPNPFPDDAYTMYPEFRLNTNPYSNLGQHQSIQGKASFKSALFGSPKHQTGGEKSTFSTAAGS